MIICFLAGVFNDFIDCRDSAGTIIDCPTFYIKLFEINFFYKCIDNLGNRLIIALDEYK